MSNNQFSIKCIRPEPNLGICESLSSAEEAAIQCALPDICIGGPEDTVTSVREAVAAGFSRIRIRGNITETTNFALTGFTHIWVDGDITWTINPDVTIDASASTGLTVEGNSVGTVVFSRTSPGSLFTGVNVVYTINNLFIDYSTSTSNNVQLVPKVALQQRHSNLTITLPNLADLQFFDFSAVNPDTSLSVENVVFVGTGINTTAVIGNIALVQTNVGNFSNITFSGTFPPGDGTFTSPLISVRCGNTVGNLIFQGVHILAPAPVVYDAILSGHSSNVMQSIGRFNITISGRFSKLDSSYVGILDIGNRNLFLSNIYCQDIVCIASGSNFLSNVISVGTEVSIGVSGNRFSNCQLAATTTFDISGDNNVFTGCTISFPTGTIPVSGDGNEFSGCVFPGGSPNTAFILVTGNYNLFSGCRKSISSGSDANFEIDGASGTIMTGCNWYSGVTQVNSTVELTNNPSDTVITSTIVDSAIAGAAGANSFVDSGASIIIV